MGERDVYAVVPAKKMNKQGRAYAERMGILIEPKWGNSNPDSPMRRPGEMLPAGNIRSGWGRNVESKTGITRRMR